MDMIFKYEDKHFFKKKPYNYDQPTVKYAFLENCSVLSLTVPPITVWTERVVKKGLIRWWEHST